MKQQDPLHVSAKVVVTLGIYSLVWFARTRDEIHLAIDKKAIPTLWWFLLPFGAYWWIWQYASCIELATKSAIKANDTFLLFLIATMAGSFGLNASFDATSSFELNPLLLVAAGFMLLANLVIYSIFFFVIQKKINALSDNTPY